MLFILHVVMKTLDKTCCHVYSYDQCLYDNMTIIGAVMYKEHALARIEILIFEITSEYEKGIAIGFIGACLTFNLISPSEYRQLSDRILAE